MQIYIAHIVKLSYSALTFLNSLPG